MSSNPLRKLRTPVVTKSDCVAYIPVQLARGDDKRRSQKLNSKSCCRAPVPHRSSTNFTEKPNQLGNKKQVPFELANKRQGSNRLINEEQGLSSSGIKMPTVSASKIRRLYESKYLVKRLDEPEKRRQQLVQRFPSIGKLPDTDVGHSSKNNNKYHEEEEDDDGDYARDSGLSVASRSVSEHTFSDKSADKRTNRTSLSSRYPMSSRSTTFDPKYSNSYGSGSRKSIKSSLSSLDLAPSSAINRGEKKSRIPVYNQNSKLMTNITRGRKFPPDSELDIDSTSYIRPRIRRSRSCCNCNCNVQCSDRLARSRSTNDKRTFSERKARKSSDRIESPVYSSSSSVKIELDAKSVERIFRLLLKQKMDKERGHHSNIYDSVSGEEYQQPLHLAQQNIQQQPAVASPLQGSYQNLNQHMCHVTQQPQSRYQKSMASKVDYAAIPDSYHRKGDRMQLKQAMFYGVSKHHIIRSVCFILASIATLFYSR